MTEELKISELPPLSPVPSGELPVSQMHGTARVTCKATVQELVQSVAPRAHSHTPADIGLGNVNNTSDANKPLSGPTATAIASALQAHVNATNPHGQYATAAQVTQIVTSQAGGLAPVQSVNGQQGAVTITKASIGLGNVADLAPAALPLSDAAAAALAGKMNVGASISASQVTGLSAAIAAGVTSGGAVTAVNGHTGNVTLGKADVGLGNVANLAPADMPVSTAVAAALGSKLDAAALAPALAGKIDSADARFTGIQRRKCVDIIWNVGGVTTIDPAMSPVFIDRSVSPSGPRQLRIATPPGNDDFEWFDVLLSTGLLSPITPTNWMWTNSAPTLGALDVIRFFRVSRVLTPGVDWVAMKMNA